MQWPRVLLGIAMAVRDTLSGGFVDFRVIPKGTGVAMLPWAVLLPYAALALVSLLPLLLIEEIADAAGFYIFALIYAVLFCVIAQKHLHENRIQVFHWPLHVALPLGCVALLSSSIVIGFVERTDAALVALTETGSTIKIFKPYFPVSGAGRITASTPVMA